MTLPIEPDTVEQELADEIDNVVPTRGYQQVPVVGLGGSAGSIEALRDFFTTMPSGSSLAFVVVMHLSPDHESVLPEVIQRCTRMPVLHASDALEVEAGHVYVIPGGKLLQCVDGKLRLDELPPGRGRHVTVDVFFRSLADSHGPHAAAIVLSGMDGDGAIGIKRVKERGGLAVAQDPMEALQEGMPRAAIGTGLVDWVLPAGEMPARLLSYFRLEKSIVLQEEARVAGAVPPDESHLRDVLGFLRNRTGRDFTVYKRATVLRRIARRMQVNGVDNLPAYLNCMRTRPGEVGALLQDLLISVTNFFRDGTCFEALEQQVPALFLNKTSYDVVRVWTAACATGEEAYTVAMLLSEYADTLDAPPAIQVFATDLDDTAIQAARQGIYPAAIVADVNEERLRRFFHKESQGYRVRRELRELVLFAVHDLLGDTPFSRLDLVTCRNLLIYLGREAQTRVLETLHFAMAPRAKLMLGSSESVDEDSGLFKVLDKKNRIFEQVPSVRRLIPQTVVQSNLSPPSVRRDEGGFGAGRGPLPPAGDGLPAPVTSATLPGTTWRDVQLQIIEQLAPPSVLVNADHEILHVSSGAAKLLRFPVGEVTNNLLRVLGSTPQLQLRAALAQAAQTGASVQLPALPLDTSDGAAEAAVRVIPLMQPTGTLFLVTFDLGDGPVDPRREGDALSVHLDFELDRLKLQLRDTAEQYEASTEELKASNEELQAMNEEMRAITEELETSKEELQSINEELSTVNQELKSKVDQLSQANSDIQNLMDATAIAIVFLDRQLRITRFTPAAIKLFNLIPGDVGRPLTDMATQLNYPDLGDDARGVLANLVPVEREVGQSDGSWYVARLMPYRTVEDRIAGVVFTFVDITGRRRAEDERLWLSAVVTSTPDAVISFGLDQTVLSWNSEAERMFGYTAQQAIGQSMQTLAPARAGEEELLTTEVEQGRVIDNLETVRRHRDGSTVHVAITAAPIRDGGGRIVAVSAILRKFGGG
jgi:two-component system CheB/CheR fusion protein